MEEDATADRRAALTEVFSGVASEMVERVAAEAVRASNFFGLSGDVAERYGRGIQATLPVALDTLTEPSAVERARKMDQLVAQVRALSDEHHVPRIIERGLVSIAFGVARQLVRGRACDSGFPADELDIEFVAFRDEFEERLL